MAGANKEISTVLTLNKPKILIVNIKAMIRKIEGAKNKDARPNKKAELKTPTNLFILIFVEAETRNLNPKMIKKPANNEGVRGEAKLFTLDAIRNTNAVIVEFLGTKLRVTQILFRRLA